MWVLKKNSGNAGRISKTENKYKESKKEKGVNGKDMREIIIKDKVNNNK